MKRNLRQLVAATCAALAGFGAFASLRAETISSAATLHYRTGTVERTLLSNSVVLHTTPVETRSVVTFMRPAPQGAAEALPIGGGQCRLATGEYTLMSGEAAATQPMVPGSDFHVGENLYFTVTDGDRNLDAQVLDTVEVTVSTSTDDIESVRLRETGENTGVFAGYLPSTGESGMAAYDCRLSVGAGARVSLSYADQADAGDVSHTEALVDPFGVTFDAETGEVVDGVRVTLVDDATGAPASVFGDDGVSAYPNSVISGQTVRDAGGAVYPGIPGHYRFPLAATGRYRLVMDPPRGWRGPSTAGPATLRPFRAPDGGGLQIDAASFGAAFDLLGPAPLRVDLPLDPVRTGLLLRKTASVSEASAGDFVQYRLSLQNPNGGRALPGAVLTDTLPAGVRVQPKSLSINGRAAELVARGRTLTVPLGGLAPSSTVEVAYVVQLEPGVREGLLINRATVTTTGRRPQQRGARRGPRISAADERRVDAHRPGGRRGVRRRRTGRRQRPRDAGGRNVHCNRRERPLPLRGGPAGDPRSPAGRGASAHRAGAPSLRRLQSVRGTPVLSVRRRGRRRPVARRLPPSPDVCSGGQAGGGGRARAGGQRRRRQRVGRGDRLPRRRDPRRGLAVPDRRA
jgi:uncharacterized repeat protein (TIGR01451 family)